MDTLEALRRRIKREQRARAEAERYAEEKTRALFERSRELEAMKENLERLVEARTAELAEARDLAIEASEAKTAFVANLSHELRTPLNAIIGYGEMLGEDLRALELEDLAHDALRILSAGNYLMVLVNDLLDLEKVESGELTLNLEEVEIEPLLVSVGELIAPQVEANRNRFELDVADTATTIRTDSTRLRQILHNLLSNAAKFTGDGLIRVESFPELRGEALFLIIEVKDTGIGIAAKDLPRIFQRFAQAGPSIARSFGGTGLGLALTRRLCQRLGGDISVASKLGAGSRFRFWLPLDPPLDA
ncbi:MAG: ATP-binding protein [Nannocystaceae bacterium]